MDYKERLANLCSVKSIVTILCTIVFCWLSITGVLSSEQFITIFTTIIAFYFGTQAQKISDTVENSGRV